MFKSKQLLATTGLALLLASCGSGPDADQAPATEASASAQGAMNDPNDPFAAAEMAMNDKMMAAVGTDASDTWVKQMIEHHRGAIAMSEVVLKHNPTDNARVMAQQTISKQGKEVEDLTKLLSKSPADPASLEPYRAANMTMHDAMMAAKGADVSETYLRKMLEHHRGAVSLSDVVLAQGRDARVRAVAQKTKADQAKEATMIEAVLAGQPMGISSVPPAPMAKPAATTSVPKTTPVANRSPVASSSPKPTPPKTTPAPATPAATPDHDMKDMPGMKM